MLENPLPQSHMKLPLSSVSGGPVAPPRKRAPHAPHRVAGPSGPGFFPLHSVALHSHQRQRQAPPSQNRMCPPTAPDESNSRAQTVQTNLPSSFTSRGPVAPLRKRPPQGLHSVLAPSGPGFLPGKVGVTKW